MPGADFHRSYNCKHPHFIRPVLFGFFQYAQRELKDFVKTNLGAPLWEDNLESYMEWLIAPPRNETPNHIKLYWWMLMFWGRLPR
jgi:hypothetical protein